MGQDLELGVALSRTEQASAHAEREITGGLLRAPT